MNENENELKLLNIKIKETTLKEWKQFCLENDFTMTNAIKKAMREMIEREQKNVAISEVTDDTVTVHLSKDTFQKLMSK